MKPSGIGGQAVIEGVMMKNKEHYAVAVRKPDNEIVIKEDTFNSTSEKHKIWKLPILRGMLSFAESMAIGIKTLNFSASFFEEEEAAKESKVDKAFSKVFKDKAEGILAAITMIIAVILAVGIFIILPTYAAGLLGKSIASDSLVAFIEGIIRIVLFILYVFAISQLNDIKRVFMYHGAEHKTINCIENGHDLTVENVRGQSREHKRCGTSFLFLVMFVSIIFFMFIRTDITWLRYASRILLVPVIAGVSYEFIRFAGKNDSILVRILSKPGMWLQRMTTREPDDDMIEVAIKSVEAVFDWRVFLGKEAETGEIEAEAENNGKKDSREVQAEKRETRQSSNRKTAGNTQGNKTKNTKSGNTQSKTGLNGKTAKSGNTAKGENTVKSGSTAKGENTGKSRNAAKSDNIAKSRNTAKSDNIAKNRNTAKSDNITKSDNAKSDGTVNNTSSKTGNNKNKRTAASSNQSSARNKSAREAAASTRREPLKAMDLFEEDDEILRAVDDFVAITDEEASEK